MKKYSLFAFYFCFFTVLMFSWMSLSSGEIASRDADFDEANPFREAKNTESPKMVVVIDRTRGETAESPAESPSAESAIEKDPEALPQPIEQETPVQPTVSESPADGETAKVDEPVTDIPPPPVTLDPEPIVSTESAVVPEPVTEIPPVVVSEPEPTVTPVPEPAAPPEPEPPAIPDSPPADSSDSLGSAPRKYEMNIFAAKTVSPSLVGNYRALLSSKKLESMISPILVEIVDDRIEPRGQMTTEKVSLVAPLASEYESIKVLAHELGHVVDIRYLTEGRVLSDPSDAFYAISWVDTSTKKPKMALSDFVSGYAMTNKYEDFGESFNYYMFHNDDFAKRAKSSKILKAKYVFFQKKIFPNQEFVGTAFESDPIPQYSWDTTKIPIALNKYLFYMK
jgi:hypothetical protein